MSDYLGFNSWKQGLLIGSLTGLGFIFANSVNSIFALGFPSLPVSIGAVTSFLVVGLVAPVVEEAVFRGVALPILMQRFGKFVALFLSALVFAGFHWLVYGASLSVSGAFIGAGIFGILAGFLALRFGLLSSIVAHSLINVSLFFGGVTLFG